MGKAFCHICNEEVATPWHGNHENNSVFGCQSLIGGWWNFSTRNILKNCLTSSKLLHHRPSSLKVCKKECWLWYHMQKRRYPFALIHRMREGKSQRKQDSSWCSKTHTHTHTQSALHYLWGPQTPSYEWPRATLT
jgi:hypothetical protein